MNWEIRMNRKDKNKAYDTIMSINQEATETDSVDIFGKLPSWSIRWGICIIFLILVAFILGCGMIRYPRTINASISVTTKKPPVNVTSKANGKIEKIFVTEKHFVTAGQWIAVIHSAADYRDVRSIFDSLQAYSTKSVEQTVHSYWVNINYNLGDLQPTFETYRTICQEYKQYLQANHIGKKKSLLKAQIYQKRKYKRALSSGNMYSTKSLQLEDANEKRYELLYKKGLISKEQLEAATKSRLQSELGKSNSNANVTNSELDILQTKQQLEELDIQMEKEVQDFRLKIKQNSQQLLASTKQWLDAYAVISPIDGRVTFTQIWSQNQNVQVGDVVASVVPIDKTVIVGRLSVSPINFGKVKLNQPVNVKISSYPYMEFGMLKGVVTSISSVPNDKGEFAVEIKFPNGLITTYGNKLPFIPQMEGTAQIVIDDISLLERILQPFKALFDS